MLDCIFKAYDMSSQTDIIFLDFKKAFDSVPHDELLLKLRKIGISGISYGSDLEPTLNPGSNVSVSMVNSQIFYLFYLVFLRAVYLALSSSSFISTTYQPQLQILLCSYLLMTLNATVGFHQ